MIMDPWDPGASPSFLRQTMAVRILPGAGSGSGPRADILRGWHR